MISGIQFTYQAKSPLNTKHMIWKPITAIVIWKLYGTPLTKNAIHSITINIHIDYLFYRFKVIWRRVHEKNPLTIGEYTYVNDDRINVGHRKGSSNWNLLIKNVQPHDSGIYECQISTKEKDIRQQIFLDVKGLFNIKKLSIIYSDADVSRKVYLWHSNIQIRSEIWIMTHYNERCVKVRKCTKMNL